MATNGTLPAKRPQLPVAVDVMGGDRGFTVQVEGAIQAYNEFGARSILVGPEQDITSCIEGLGGKDIPIRVRNATQVITMEDSPTRAVRRKRDSSLCVAYGLVENGDASAVLSAGNSGAMMAAGRFICGFVPGIERPAIATLIPVAGNGNPNVILDSGANVDCHAHNLVQFAVMGAIYYSSLFDEGRPRVALLSNGTESSKGTDLIRAAAVALEGMAGINYIGYVEGRDVMTNSADVIVCDGFVGNVLLKVSEGVVRLIYDQIMHESRRGFMRKFGLGMSKGILKDVFTQKFDYTAHGGAPLLGLRKLAIVLHGSSDSRAVKNAIRLADSFAESGMTEKITAALSSLEDEAMSGVDEDILSGVFAKTKELTAGEPAKGKKAVNESEEIQDAAKRELD